MKLHVYFLAFAFRPTALLVSNAAYNV